MIEESIFQPVNNFEYPDLPNIDLNSSLDSNNLIYNYSELLKDKAEEKYNKDLEDWVNSHNEDLGNDLDNLFYPETNNQTYKFKQSKGYNAVKSVMDKLVTDSTKKNILLKIAEKESNFNSNAKNPKSSASGLFGFIDSTKQRFGYGKSIEEQIIGASKLYDSMYSQLSYYVNKYGTKNKSLEQLMYGMWFRPKSLLNYLKTGYDSYTDAQGTGLNKIFTKMAQKGMKFQNKVDTIEKSVTQYLGYNPNTKFGKVQAAYNQVNSFNRKQPNLTNNNMNTVKNYNTRQAVIIDKKDNPNIVTYKTLAPYKEMSGADPIGQFVVESAGLGLLGSTVKQLGLKAVKKFGKPLVKNLFENSKVVSYMEGPKPGQNIRQFKESILDLEKKNGSVGKIFQNPDVHHLQRNVYREAMFLPEIKSIIGQDYRKLVRQAIISKEDKISQRYLLEAENLVKKNSTFKALMNQDKALEGIRRVQTALHTARNPKVFDFRGFSDMPYTKKKEWLLNDSKNPRGMVHPDLNIPFVANPTDYGNLAVPLHEGEHAYQNLVKKISGEYYTPEQAKLLNDTYLTGINPYTSAISSASNIKEKGAFNKEVLKNIETQYIKLFNKQPTYNELNQYIDNLAPNDLFKALKTNTSKYSQNYLDNIDYVWNNYGFNKKQWVESFKNSLKYVPASIPLVLNTKNK